MIQNEQEYRAALQRIERFQKQVEHLRKTEPNPHPTERSGLAVAN